MSTTALWSYPLIMLASVVVGGWLLSRSQGGIPLQPAEKIALGIGAFCGAMIGAKLPFALYDWEGLRDGTVWFSNGKTIVCGLVGAYIGVEITKWIYRIRVRTGDSFACLPLLPSALVG